MAFYWEGDVPKGHRVRDISKHGAYIETKSLSWSRGTLMILTMQLGRTIGSCSTPRDTITVPAEVVRSSAEGLGLKFLFHNVDDRRRLLQFLARWKALEAIPEVQLEPDAVPQEAMSGVTPSLEAGSSSGTDLAALPDSTRGASAC